MITYKGRQIPQTFEEIVNPAHTVLIVHEMRNNLREKGAFDKDGNAIKMDVDGIVEPISKLVDAARKKNIRIIYAGFVGGADESLYSEPMIARSYERLMDPGRRPPPPGAVVKTRDWQVIDELKPQEGDIILAKPRVDCFIGTDLELLLRWNGIKTIVIGGVGSEIGILPTVFHAVNLGFFVVAPEDCLRPTGAAWHDDAIKFIAGNIHGHVAIVGPSSDVLKAWAS